MNPSKSQTTRPSWVSKTTFEALGVESGEESEEEVVEETAPLSSPPESSSESPVRPSKTALKKAKDAARLERRQQRKAERATLKTQPRNQQDTAHPEPEDASLNSSGILSDSLSIIEINEDDPDASSTQLSVAANDADIPNGQKLVNGGVESNLDITAPSQDHLASEVEPPVVSPPVINGRPTLSDNTVVDAPKFSAKDTTAISSRDVEGALEKHAGVQDVEQVKKRQNILTRTLWTFIMIGGFLTLLLMGHAYMIMLVMLCQTLVYREVTALFSLKRKDSDEEGSRGKDPWSKTLNWYFFAITNYFLYGESIIYYFKHVVFADAHLTLFATNHRMISFTLYTIGFMGFVLSLKRGYLKTQFGLFCWVHMTLLFIVVSSHFIVNNILEGMVWFWVPAFLVICNDVFAYIWGITLGRTPLIKLSPKKTVEGFVGAFVSTVIFGVLWGTYFMRFEYMICPVQDLGVSAWSGTLHCTPNPVFVWREWAIPVPLRVFLSTLLGHQVTSIPYATYQIHLFFMSCFASLVAPFGGFFASGFKRAFNIKDFGHSIPGHGGMTDRMDCQFLMGVYTYVYYSSLIRQHHVSVGSLLQMIVSGLTPSEQLELMADLKRYMEGQGIAVNI
ncbi:hypothetical protein AcW1_008740 [Taiwanofungus camphoratus]|nr:hypothetical protein AcV5_006757 [Antrodia cinnamomea]KAI0935295.1 hypothetical protein AcV7_003774 [Antrodia cinnamomea]KAI0949024.1 hypothetical protein AcW1_008740 [Antrodia cinnamomea]